MSSPRAGWTDAAKLAAATLVVFVVTPLFVAAQNPGELATIDVTVLLLSGLTLWLPCALVLAGASFLLRGLRLSAPVAAACQCVLAWTVVSGLYLPACPEISMVDPAEVPVDPLRLAGIVAVCGLILWHWFRARSSLTTRFLLLSAVAGLFWSVGTLVLHPGFRASNAGGGPDESLRLSRTRNVLVLSLDGVPGALVSDILGSDEGLASELRDFTLFESAVSQAPATEASLVADLYGVQDYKSISKSPDELWDILDARLGKSVLARQAADSYRTGYGMGFAPFMLLDQGAHAFEARVLAGEKALELIKLSLTRFAVGSALSSPSIERAFRFARDLWVPRPPPNSMTERVLGSAGPQWDRSLLATIEDFEFMLEGLQASDKPLSVRYMHFTFTHFPVDFDADCALRSVDQYWQLTHQNEAGLRGQTSCALRQFARFVDRLKALGIYDQSLIVLKSDHGEPRKYYRSPPGNLAINGHRLWGFDRHRPTLLIKGPGVRREHLERQARTVVLGDLAMTVCRHGGMDLPCAPLHGADLLSDRLDQFDEPYYLYVVPDANGTHHYESLISVRIPTRKLGLREAMEQSGKVTLSVP